MTENGCLMLGQRFRKPRTEFSVAKSRCLASKKISCVSIQFEKSCKLSKPMSRRGCLESSTGSLGELSNLFSCNILSLLRRVGSIVSVFFLPSPLLIRTNGAVLVWKLFLILSICKIRVCGVFCPVRLTGFWVFLITEALKMMACTPKFEIANGLRKATWK